jgi:hypothetical protein
MKATLKVRPNLVIEIDEEKMTEVFEALSCAQEVFSENCRKCGSDQIEYSTRTHDNSTFYELKCGKCFSILQISPHNNKSGTLFTRRYDLDDDKNKVWLDDKGWKKWNKETKSYE